MNSKTAVKTSLVGTGAAALVLGFTGVAGAQTYPDGGSASSEDSSEATEAPAATADEAPIVTADDATADVEAVPLTPADSGDSTGSVATATQTPAVAVQQQQQLPVTGGEAATIAIFGSILVAGGGLLVWRSKGEELDA